MKAGMKMKTARMFCLGLIALSGIVVSPAFRVSAGETGSAVSSAPKRTAYRRNRSYSRKKNNQDFLFGALPAAAAGRPDTLTKPKVRLRLNMGSVEYEYVPTKVVRQRCETEDAVGCTAKNFSYSMAVLPNGDLLLEIGLIRPFLVSVSNDYPKGSCGFDQILKHELTHVATSRSVLEDDAPKVAALIADDLEKRDFPYSREDLESFHAIAQKGVQKILEKTKKMDAILDDPANNRFGWLQCSEDGKREANKSEKTIRNKTDAFRKKEPNLYKRNTKEWRKHRRRNGTDVSDG